MSGSSLTPVDSLKWGNMLLILAVQSRELSSKLRLSHERLEKDDIQMAKHLLVESLRMWSGMSEVFDQARLMGDKYDK
jgi:hypothetical protein